jgi:hypothetical protein
MTTYEREPQPESWWRQKTCPVMSCREDDWLHCEASDCAFWRQTGEREGEKHGICTKA